MSDRGAPDHREPGGLPRLPARLVSDTADLPLRPGLRSREVLDRHQLYEAGGLCLDLRMERDPKGGRAALTGQLADRRQRPAPVASAPVLLLAGDEVLGRTGTNRLGEFYLEFEPRQGMSLRVASHEGLVEVPVDRRTTRRPGEPARPDSFLPQA